MNSPVIVAKKHLSHSKDYVEGIKISTQTAPVKNKKPALKRLFQLHECVFLQIL